MSSVKLNHALGGSTTLEAGDTASAETITLPAGNKTLADTGVTDALSTRVNAAGGRKNLIINGGMQISQRGDYTTATSISGGAYYLDRWKIWLGGVTATIQKTTATINGKTKDIMRVEATSTASGYIGFLQAIEGLSLPKNEDVIVSAWVRSNNSYVRFRENWFDDADSNSPVFTADGAWQKVTWTIGGKQTPSSGNVAIGIITYDTSNIPVTTGDYIEVAEFQLELGSVATDFEHRSYGEELALCQRYYIGYRGTNNAYWMFSGITDASYLHISSGGVFPTEMRVAPSVTIYSASGDGYIDAYGRGQYGQGNAGATENTTLGFNTVSLQAGGGSATGNAGAIMRGGYRADAEL